MTRPWIVTAHDPIVKHEDNLWTVAGDVPGLNGIRRRMAIVKLADGRLLFYNAIPLDDATLAEVKAWGRPSLLIIPNFAHCIDGVAFRERLGLEVYGPAADKKLPARIQVDGDLAALPADPSIHVEQVAGCKLGEPVLTVSSGPGGARKTLFFSDAMMNVRHGRGLRGFVFKLLGFTGDQPRVAAPWKTMFVSDKGALRAHYDRWAAVPGLVRLIPTHGDIVESDPVGALRGAAATI